MDFSGLGQATIPMQVKRQEGFELFAGVCEPLARDTPADQVLRAVKQFCSTI